MISAFDCLILWLLFISLRGGNHSALAGGGSRAPLLE